MMELYQQISSGTAPPEVMAMFAEAQKKMAKDGVPGAGGAKQAMDPEGGMTIQPRKGFVVKTKDVKTGGKVFLNMTVHESVDPFEYKSLPTTGDKDEPEQGLRIPLSLGDVREENDKKGDPA